MASCRDIYVLVWNRAVTLGAHVEYDRHLYFLVPKGSKGLFNPNETETHTAAPTILIGSLRMGTAPKHDHLSDDEVASGIDPLP